MESIKELIIEYKKTRLSYLKAKSELDIQEIRLNNAIKSSGKLLARANRIHKIENKCSEIGTKTDKYKCKLIELKSKIIELTRDPNEKEKINKFVQNLVDKLRKSFKRDTKCDSFNTIAKKETLGNILVYRFYIKSGINSFEINITGYNLLLKATDFHNSKQCNFDFKSSSVDDSYNQIVDYFNKINI